MSATNVRALRPRLYHRGDKIRADGAVSALCFSSPKAIDLSRAMWTLSDEGVTCPKCKALIAKRKESTAGFEVITDRAEIERTFAADAEAEEAAAR